MRSASGLRRAFSSPRAGLTSFCANANGVDYDDRDYDYADDWSVTDDPGFEDAARDWADNNAGELIAAYAESDLDTATVDTHKQTWPLVQKSLERAEQRKASADWDEAAFHYSRALEGYVRAVYLNPVFEVMTRAFEDRMKVSKLLAHDIVPAQLKNAKRLLLFALVGATENTKEATSIGNAIAAAMGSKAWRTRNRIDHSLYMPESAEVTALEEAVRTTLEIASKPIADRISAEEERHRKLAEDTQRRRAQSPFSV